MGKKYLIDLFCGAGGFSEGARQAGFEVIIAVDAWDEALETHQLNHPNTVHLLMELGDTYTKTWNILKKYIPKLNKDDHLHIHASPPCQNLSTANSGYRNIQEGLRLCIWYLEFIINIKKKVKNQCNFSWTMEQVNNNEFKQLLNEQYSNVYYNIYNMEEYGIPQTRARIFVCNKNITLKKSKKINKYIYEYLEEYEPYYKYTKSCSGIHFFRDIMKETYVYTITSIPTRIYDNKMNHIRPLTVNEHKIFQTFPKTYIFNGLKKDQIKQIGNSVPPKFAKQIMHAMII